MNNVDKLIAPSNLTDELLNTQICDKIEEYKTLGYNKKELQIRRTQRNSKLLLQHIL